VKSRLSRGRAQLTWLLAQAPTDSEDRG
jgi:hypothetical protein